MPDQNNPKRDDAQERAAFEAAILAPPYEKDVSRLRDDGSSAWPGNYRDYAVELAWCMWQAARAPAVRQAVAPSGYAYRYPDGIRFNNGREVNGSRPTEVLPYWFDTPPTQPKGAQEAEFTRCQRPDRHDIGSPQCTKCNGDVLECPSYYVPREVNKPTGTPNA